MKLLFGLVLSLSFLSAHASAALQQQDLMAPERYWIKSQKIQFIQHPVAITPNAQKLNLPFRKEDPKMLIERGDISVKRKILMNAAGNAMAPEFFQFDVQLELNYTFS